MRACAGYFSAQWEGQGPRATARPAHRFARYARTPWRPIDRRAIPAQRRSWRAEQHAQTAVPALHRPSQNLTRHSHLMSTACSKPSAGLSRLRLAHRRPRRRTEQRRPHRDPRAAAALYLQVHRARPALRRVCDGSPYPARVATRQRPVLIIHHRAANLQASQGTWWFQRCESMVTEATPRQELKPCSSQSLCHAAVNAGGPPASTVHRQNGDTDVARDFSLRR